MGATTGQLARGSLWVSASRALVNSLGFISTIALARLLVPADFGLVALAATMLAILSAVTNLSLSEALVHHQAPTLEHFNTAWSLGTARGVLIATLFALASKPAASFYGDPRLTGVMLALALGIILSGMTNPRTIIMQKKLVFWQEFMLDVSQKLVMVIVSVAIAFAYRNYWALVFGQLAGQLVNVVLSYTVFPFRPRIGVRHMKELWSFSVWLTLSQVVNTINWKFDQLLIGKFLGRTALGLYTVGDNLSIMPSRESTLPLTRTLFPAFSHMQGDLVRLRRAYQRAQSLVTAIALPLGVGMALVAEPMIRLVMGEKWLPAASIIQCLASIFAIQTLGTLAQPLGMSQGATHILFKRDIQMFCVRLPFIVAGMYFGGLMGVVYARIVTGLIAIGFNMTLVRSFIALPIRDQIAANARTLTAVAAMSVSVLVLDRLLMLGHSSGQLIARLAIEVGVGGATYLVVGGLAWTFAGRPVGPESEVARAIEVATSWLRARRRGTMGQVQ